MLALNSSVAFSGWCDKNLFRVLIFGVFNKDHYISLQKMESFIGIFDCNLLGQCPTRIADSVDFLDIKNSVE